MIVSNFNNSYDINENELKKHKLIAKKAYQKYILWCKNKNYKVCPPGLGSVETDFILHYKTNGLKKFDNYLLFIKSTKEHFYFN